MTSEILELHAERLLRRIEEAGLSVEKRKELANGLQYSLRRDEETCRINLYYSRKKGFSIVPAGGPEELLELVEGLAERPVPKGVWAGSDEAGKGDYFGGLVVCAFCCDETTANLLRGSGVVDSKMLANSRLREVASAVRERAEGRWSLRHVGAEDYNRALARLKGKGRNSLDLLAEMHGGAVADLLSSGCAPDRVVVDRFCDQERLAPLLPDGGYALEVYPGAESDPAVAAASILARDSYLDELSELSERFGVRLSPGSGWEADRSGAELVGKHGERVLASAAKLHFQNTGRVKEISRLNS